MMLSVLLCAVLFSPSAFAAVLTGRVALPPYSGPIQQPTTTLTLTDSAGSQRRTHCLVDGSFRFQGLAAGSYVLDVGSLRYMYPQYRVDVPDKAGAPVEVSFLSGSKATLLQPPVLQPLGEMKYYQPRKPIDIRGLLLSPYGIMVAVAIFVIIVMPSMKMDPEEYKKLQEEMKDSPWAGMMGLPKETASGPAKQIKNASGSNAKRR